MKFSKKSKPPRHRVHTGGALSVVLSFTVALCFLISILFQAFFHWSMNAFPNSGWSLGILSAMPLSMVLAVAGVRWFEAKREMLPRSTERPSGECTSDSQQDMPTDALPRKKMNAKREGDQQAKTIFLLFLFAIPILIFLFYAFLVPNFGRLFRDAGTVVLGFSLIQFVFLAWGEACLISFFTSCVERAFNGEKRGSQLVRFALVAGLITLLECRIRQVVDPSVIFSIFCRITILVTAYDALHLPLWIGCINLVFLVLLSFHILVESHPFVVVLLALFLIFLLFSEWGQSLRRQVVANKKW